MRQLFLLHLSQTQQLLLKERNNVKKSQLKHNWCIENMSHIELGDSKLYPFGKGGGEVLSENLKVPLIGQLL